MNNEENKVTEVGGTEEKKPTLAEILKAEEAELKAKKKAEKAKRKGKVAYDINGNVIPDLNVKHVRGIESKKSFYGRMFILPWEIGMLLFFIYPLINSLLYAFSDVSPNPGEMRTDWVGAENFNFIFKEDPNFMSYLTSSLSSFFTSLPIIVIVSLILALILNTKFKGRVVFRGIFFVPVIVATGVVMTLLTKSWGSYGQIIQLSSEVAQDAYSSVGVSGGLDFTEMLRSLELPDEITNTLNTLITNIFNTIWTCGIPVVLFISGLQTIPSALYEASKVEGATKWEEFWYITIPMLGQTILLVIVFTLIELFTQANNELITWAYSLMQNINYGIASAALWVYFAIIGVITGLIILIFSKTCLKRWE